MNGLVSQRLVLEMVGYFLCEGLLVRLGSPFGFAEAPSEAQERIDLGPMALIEDLAAVKPTLPSCC